MRNIRWMIGLGVSGLLLLAAAACGEGEEAKGDFSGAPLVTLHLKEAGLRIEARSLPQPPKQGLVDVELRVTSAEGAGGQGGDDGGEGGHHDEGQGGHGGHHHGDHEHDEGHGGAHQHHGSHALRSGATSGLAIRVIPWMGEHGHGSNEVEAEEVEAGRYLARGVLFSMPGNWELKLAIEGLEGMATSASFQVLP